MHGPDAFIIVDLLCSKSEENAMNFEIQFIKELKTLHPFGYNLMSGGKGGLLPAAIVREKMVKSSHTGKINGPHSEETRNKISKSITGQTRSVETKLKCSVSAKNRPPITNITRQKLQVFQSTRIRQPHSEETKKKFRGAWILRKQRKLELPP